MSAPASPRVTPGSTEHLILLAARASGRIEYSALTDRLGERACTAISRLCRAGLMDRVNGYRDVVLLLTPAGRAACPARRDIPLTPLYDRPIATRAEVASPTPSPRS